MQSHLDVRSGSDAFPAVNVYEKAVKAFTETGLDVQVTELDATVNDTEHFAEQAQYYSDIMDVLVKYADKISSVVFWGTTDDQSWRASKTPLLFNEDYSAKESFYSIIDGLDYDEEIPEETTTTATENPVSENTTTTTSEIVTGDVVYGDANLDGKVSISDAVAILQYVANASKYNLDDKAKANADVDGNPGVTGKDAAVLQQVDAGVYDVSQLPLKPDKN
jgi:endo-1,4-beta-xylanase